MRRQSYVNSPAPPASLVPFSPRRSIAWQIDQLFPLASVSKVLLLGLYAEEVAAQRLDPEEPIALSAIEHWYWPNTDGGAHPEAVEDWRSQRWITNETVALDHVVWAALRWSSNAAADYLRQRLGGTAGVSAYAARMGMSRQEPIGSIFGETVAWASERNRWLEFSPEERARRAESYGTQAD